MIRKDPHQKPDIVRTVGTQDRRVRDVETAAAAPWKGVRTTYAPLPDTTTKLTFFTPRCTLIGIYYAVDAGTCSVQIDHDDDGSGYVGVTSADVTTTPGHKDLYPLYLDLPAGARIRITVTAADPNAEALHVGFDFR